jgi:aminopeptidase YwaD
MFQTVRLRPLLVPGLVLAMAAASGCAAEARAASAGRAQEGTPATGTIVDGAASPMRFHPAEAPAAKVDVDALNLRYVFETIGEDATLWYQHVQTLANPYFEGRADGSAGIERARDYLEFYFRLYGLEPAFPDADSPSGGSVSYRQPFEFSAGRRLQATVENAHAAINDQALVEDEQFTVLGNSSSGEAAGPITFVGYGINRGKGGYSSFDDDSDLVGRVALLLRYEPLDEDGDSQWTEEGFSPQAGVMRKMRAVKERGAAGIILVNPPGCRAGKTRLEPLSSSMNFGRSTELPTIQVTMETAERLLKAADPAGRDLMTWRRLADRGEVTTVDLDDSVQVSFGATVQRERIANMIPAANVGAVLRGRGELADEWLVIGAHFDHNGYGFFGTTPEAGPLMPGADDNASGTAGVLILARMLAEVYAEADADRPARSVLLLGFDAEERGLHGSRFFCRNSPIPTEQMTAMLNMDMIGRLRSDELSVFGAGTGEGLAEIVRPHFENSGLTVAVSAAGSGQADDANFRHVGVPAMHFFTGVHPEYTSPADQAYTVNPVGAMKVLDLMYDISLDLVTRPQKVRYAEPQSDRGSDRGYARVRLGIRPGMADDLESGILVEGVSVDTSAFEAGITGGDIMLAWNGEPLQSMRDLFNHLQEHEPGDVVIITIQRGEEQMDLEVKLKASEGDERGRRDRGGAGGE